MNATEVRVGNLAIDATGDERAIDLSDFAYESDTTFDFEKWSPIPLTEDWLLKFGFKKSCGISDAWSDKNHFLEVYNYDGVEEYADGSKRVKGMKESDYAICSNDGYVPISRPFQYVHQLQNIVFALTGEELEIK